MVEPAKGVVSDDNQGDGSGDLVLTVVDSRSGDIVLNVEDSGEKEGDFELTETEMEETGFVSGDNQGNSSGDLVLKVVDSRSGDLVLNVEDSGEKETDLELTEREMEETLNENQGITVANLLLSKGFTLEEQDSGRFAFFGPNSRDSLIEFDREEDYHNSYSKLSIRDVIDRYPEYASLLGGVVCEVTGKGKRELVPQVKGKGRKRMVCDTCHQAIVKRRERGKKGQAQKKGPLGTSSTSVKVTPEIRSSQAIAQMAFTWLMEKAAISRNIEKSKQVINESNVKIQKCIDSIKHHEDSIEKNQSSLLHFEAKVVEALNVVNESMKAIIVSSVKEYNNLKPYLRAEVQVFCPEKSSHKDEVECAVIMDNRAFFTF